MLDTLGRRSPKKRTPTDGVVVHARPRDLCIFEAMERHGPLPSNYLYELCRDTWPNPHYLRQRLTRLYHEKNPEGGFYLDRPEQQRAAENYRSRFSVYDLTDHSRAFIEQHEHAPRIRPGQWHHDFMTGCIAASIEIAAKKHGLGFIPHHEIVARSAARFDIDGKALVPDRMFGLRYKDNSVRLFLLEADRSTEQQSTFGYKVRNYKRFIGDKLYKEAMGINSGVLMLTVTNGALRLQNLLATTAKETGGANYTLFKHAPHFGDFFQPPPIMYDLLEEPWFRPNKPPMNLLEA